MENYELVERLNLLFKGTCQGVDLKGFLDQACDDLQITDWESLAGFLLDLDRRNEDAVDPMIRGFFVCSMFNLDFKHMVLIYLRQENAIRLLSACEPSQEICPETDGPRACAWALTTFWHRTRRTELEFVAKRHLGIAGCR